MLTQSGFELTRHLQIHEYAIIWLSLRRQFEGRHSLDLLKRLQPVIRHCTSAERLAILSALQDALTLASQPHMSELTHQYCLVDQVVLDNQDVRLRPESADFHRRALLQWRATRFHVPIARSLLRLASPRFDEEPECTAFAMFARDLNPPAH